MNRGEIMKDDLLKKIEDLYDLDKHQEIIDMIEALPTEQLNNELIGQLARAYNNIQNYKIKCNGRKIGISACVECKPL